MPNDIKELLFMAALVLLVIDRGYALSIICNGLEQVVSDLAKDNKKPNGWKPKLLQTCHEDFKFIFTFSILLIFFVIVLTNMKNIGIATNELGGAFLGLIAFAYSTAGTTLGFIKNNV